MYSPANRVRNSFGLLAPLFAKKFSIQLVVKFLQSTRVDRRHLLIANVVVSDREVVIGFRIVRPQSGSFFVGCYCLLKASAVVVGVSKFVTQIRRIRLESQSLLVGADGIVVLPLLYLAITHLNPRVCSLRILVDRIFKKIQRIVVVAEPKRLKAISICRVCQIACSVSS